jgi:hypothetical protein
MCAFFCMLAILCISGTTRAAGKGSDTDRVEKIRAGFLYHLAKLVTWDETRFQDSRSPIVVGFLGESTFGLSNYFESQAPSYKAQNRNMIVKRFSLPAPDADKKQTQKQLGEISRCHILYVPQDMEYSIQKFPELFDTQGMVIVGETRGFTEKRGLIGLEIVKDHFVIFANRGNIKRAGLSISAKFLQHATIVEAKPDGAGKSQ